MTARRYDRVRDGLRDLETLRWVGLCLELDRAGCKRITISSAGRPAQPEASAAGNIPIDHPQQMASKILPADGAVKEGKS